MIFPSIARRRTLPVPTESFGVLLLSAEHERAHYAFVLASGAAALGRKVILFATNRGCHALLKDWSGLENSARDALLRERGIAGLDALREAARELKVRLVACEAGLRAEDLESRSLYPGVEIAGVATFLEAVGGGTIVSL